MSLINEALKKAQRDRPQMTPAPPPGGPMPPPHPREPGPKRKHRSFLWGFLLAVLLVAGVSSLLAAYLVLNLLDPKPTPAPAESAVQAVEPLPPASETATPAPEQAPPEKETVIPEASSTIVAELPETPVPDNPPPEPVSSLPEPGPTPPAPPVPEQPETLVAAPSPAPAETGSLPNPEVIKRLRDLEVRGLMSGATKVLLFDSSTGKTRVFKAGDQLEDPYGLSIHSISTNSVKFKDYAGHIHTKSF